MQDLKNLRGFYLLKDDAQSVQNGKSNNLQSAKNRYKDQNIIVELNTLHVHESKFHFVKKRSVVDSLGIHVVLGYFFDEIPYQLFNFLLRDDLFELVAILSDSFFIRTHCLLGMASSSQRWAMAQ